MTSGRILEVTAEELVDLAVPQDVRISPSGELAVYASKPIARKGEHTISSLWIAELGKEHSARQLTSGLFNDSSPQWCPDTSKGDCIAFVSDRAKSGEPSAIYILSLSGSEPYPVTKADNKKDISPFKWSPNGQFIAFISPDEKSDDQEARKKETGEVKVYGEDWEYNRLRVLHVATREVSTLVTAEVHVTDFAWSENSKIIAYVTQNTPDVDSSSYHGIQFGEVNLSADKNETIGERRFPGPIYDLAWSGNNLFFLAGATPNKSATSVCVYKMSVFDGEWLKYAHGEIDCVSSLRSITRGSKQDLAFKVLCGLTDNINTIRQGTSDSADADECVFSHSNHELQTWDLSFIPSANAVARKVVIGYSTASRPTEIYSFEDNKFCQLTDHGHTVVKYNIGEAEPIHCKARDGTLCDGVFVRPTKAEKGKPLSTVVLIHGGPYHRISISFNLLYFYWGPMLVSAGYGVLCPNYRGGSGHGEDYAAQARAAMGTNDFEDVIALVKKGVDDGLINPEKVVIGGYSQGGFLSYLAVTRNDFHFKGAICGAGVADWDMLSMSSETPCSDAELAGSAPWTSTSDNTKSRHGSAIWSLKNVKTPILILHGENDGQVPLNQAVAFHRGCLHYGVPCEFVTYPRERHSIKERAHVLDMLKRIRRFVDLHLK